MEKTFIKSLYPECNTMDEVEQLFIRCYDKRFDELNGYEEENQGINIDVNTNDQYECFMEKRFYFFYESIIIDSIQKIEKEVNNIEIPTTDKKEMFENITDQMLDRVIDIVFRTLVFEIRKAKEKGILIGATSADRYMYFEKQLLRNKEYKSYLYEKYKNLVAVVKKNAENFAEYVQELLKNINNDYEQLDNYFFHNSGLGALCNVQMAAGDMHRNGRTVSIIDYENGRVIYKPRNCMVDSEFQKLLEFYNDRFENKEKLNPMLVLNKGEYGWFEFISNKACQNKAEIKAYYYKLGEMLALLYFLNANDFHQENIIASGDNPYLIDLETLFNPEIDYQERKFDTHGAFVCALDTMKTSVYSIGILPNILKIGNREEKAYLGGGAGEEAQICPIKSLRVVNDRTDEITLELTNYIMTPEKNLPRINEKAESIFDYKEEFIEGFTDAYEQVLNNKDKFIAYVLEHFVGAKVRVLLKATYLYAQLGSIVKHPVFQTSKANNQVILARIALNQTNKKVIRSEIESMSIMEIPYFFTVFDDDNIYDFIGRPMDIQVVRNAKDGFLNKMRQLSQKDLEKQKEIIYGTLFKESYENLHTKISYERNTSLKINKNMYMDTARKIADYFCDTAICGKNELGNKDVVWIGSSVEHADYNNWAYSVNDMNLYNGNAGIALFLLNAWKRTGIQRYYNYARYAAEPLIRVIQNKTFNYTENTGGFIGIGSFYYVVHKIAKVSKDTRFYHEIGESLDALDRVIIKSVETDIVAGDAGMMAVLMNLLEDENMRFYNEKIKKIIGILFENIKKAVFTRQKIMDYSGYAHGIAGVIPVLYRYYLLTGKDEASEYVQILLDYERTYFYMKDAQNWRKDKKDDNYGKAWCHGSPGILLEKLQLKTLGYNDMYLDEEIQIGINNIINFGLGNGISYCHGDMGNLELLAYAAHIIKNPTLIKKCNQMFYELYEKNIKDQWNNKMRSAFNYKGIMLGLSGQGYALLRNAADEWQPELLILS